ncbi:MAG: GNAT family N-acetyltransferase, partial [Betaproteobacteria bacterium]|nr:GNAT family N-acetyltransferase [Betaproteobacteria bacterium]
NSNPSGYELCIANGDIVGAFGLIEEGENQRRLDWILLNKNSQGFGIGSMIMNRVLAQARETNVAIILITTSHKVYNFFEKFGAIKVFEIENGLGPRLHRVDMELRL